MTDASVEADDGEAVAKPSKLPLIIGLVLALLGGGGGFLAVQMGLLPGVGGTSEAHDDSHAGGQDTGHDDHAAEPLGDVSFLELPPLVVSLGPGASAEHLRFRASLEVPKKHAGAVEAIIPRIQDVLNSYLRAVELADIESPGALLRLRAQMLRRVQLVAGEGRVADLLVLEFVLT